MSFDSNGTIVISGQHLVVQFNYYSIFSSSLIASPIQFICKFSSSVRVQLRVRFRFKAKEEDVYCLRERKFPSAVGTSQLPISYCLHLLLPVKARFTPEPDVGYLDLLLFICTEIASISCSAN